MIFIILALIILFIFYNEIGKNEVTELEIKNSGDNSKLDSIYESLKSYLRYIDYLSAINNVSLNIPKSWILATATQEAGNQITSGLDSKDISGDNGKSLGFMQIQEVAFNDVKARYNLRYSYFDIKDNSINLFVGGLYLQMCYEKAVNEGSINPVLLTFRKYNSGINNAKESNDISSNYGNSVFNYFTYYNNLV